jgi:hypothetical protein
MMKKLFSKIALFAFSSLYIRGLLCIKLQGLKFFNLLVMLRYMFFLLLFATGFVVYPGADEIHSRETGFEARINASSEGECYKFVGSLMNYTGNEIECSYELQVARTGRSGSSSSFQKGKVTAKPGKETILSSSSVNIGKTDCCRVTLLVRSRNVTIAMDTLNINCLK